MKNSSLVSYTKISPNKTIPRNGTIDTITIHCYVGQVEVERIGEGFSKSSRQASCNYGIGTDGRIALIVEEKDRSWCTGGKDKNGQPILVNGISGADNDHRAVTIECASDTKPPYAINDAVYTSLIDLCTDICKRNGIKELKWKGDKSLVGQPEKQNLTVHRWFANKACPGDYIYDRLGQIADEVNARLNLTVKKEVIYRVQTGAFRNKDYADNLYRKVKAAGFSVCMVKVGTMYKVQVGAYKKLDNANNMAKKLTEAGFEACITTNGGEAVAVTTKKSIDTIAKEVIAGKWGNGSDRKARLTKAGYDYAAVQKRVNELL